MVYRTKSKNWVEICFRGQPGDKHFRTNQEQQRGEGELVSWEELSHPAHSDKELHMNGHHFVLLYCSKQMNLFSPFGRQSSVRSFRARIKAQRIAIRA